MTREGGGRGGAHLPSELDRCLLGRHLLLRAGEASEVLELVERRAGHGDDGALGRQQLVGAARPASRAGQMSSQHLTLGQRTPALCGAVAAPRIHCLHLPALAVPGEAARLGERALGRALPPRRPLEVPLEQRLAQISSMLPRAEVLAAAPCP